jgi:hypothetical protein
MSTAGQIGAIVRASGVAPSGEGLPLPINLELPIFVYGALKPGMPAFEQLRGFVEDFKPDQILGALFVRDGLPLLAMSGDRPVGGFCLRWREGNAGTAYLSICEFEPKRHYEWHVAELVSGEKANVLVGKHLDRGNPEPLMSDTWSMTDDPAFSEGLQTVRKTFDELEFETSSLWHRFFKAQMAYLLLWSILERLATLCFGAGSNPNWRVDQLHRVDGMAELLQKFVRRQDIVSDTRDPKSVVRLDIKSPKNCFRYYYQVRSNLSHRGKAIHNEYDKVRNSLEELLNVTECYCRRFETSDVLGS